MNINFYEYFFLINEISLRIAEVIGLYLGVFSTIILSIIAVYIANKSNKYQKRELELAEMRASDFNTPKKTADFYTRIFEDKKNSEIEQEKKIIDSFERIKESISKTTTKLAIHNREVENKRNKKVFLSKIK